MKLITLSLAWIAGIYVGSLVSPPLYFFLLTLVPLLIIILLWRKKRALLWGGLCLIALLSALGCYQWRTSEPTLLPFNDQEAVVELKGVVAVDPAFESDYSRLSLSAQEIQVDGQWEKISGKVLVFTDSFPSYSQGDQLKISGELLSLSQIEDPGYRDYLIRQGFSSTIFYPQITFIQRGWIFHLRDRLSQSVSSALPEPQASLAQALLLGIRTHIPDSLTQSFRRSGTTHLIAISGQNIVILAGIVLSIAAWLFGRRRPTYIIVTMAMVWLYALLAGMQPPVVRASIMFSLFLIALWLGRPRSAMPSLTLAAAIMVGITPEVLRDVSFQLSFVAVAGLILLYPIFQRWGRKAIGEERGALTSVLNPIIDSLAVTLAATIATFPLIAYYFGQVSLVSIPATFFALLALPGAIIATLLTALLGLFAPALSSITGWAAWLFLSYTIKVVEGFGSLNPAGFGITLNGVMVWGYYGGLLAIFWREHLIIFMSRLTASIKTVPDKLPRFPHHPLRKWILISLAIAAALIWIAAAATPDRKLEVNFLDVGQGDAILIQTPSGHQILIDGGPAPDMASLRLGENLPFWDKSLDLVILTHPENDHIAGLVEVLQRYKIGQILEPGIEHDIPAYQEWLSLIEEKNIKHTTAQAGQDIELGDGIVLEVLNPQEELFKDTDSDANNNSVVLRLVWNKISFLLTGDISEQAEREIIYSGYKVNCTVLKVAHHGSATSTSSHFLAAVDPQVAVISVGKDNTFGHPNEDILARLREQVDEDKIYLTSEQGTINITTDGERLWVETEK